MFIHFFPFEASKTHHHAELFQELSAKHCHYSKTMKHCAVADPGEGPWGPMPLLIFRPK